MQDAEAKTVGWHLKLSWKLATCRILVVNRQQPQKFEAENTLVVLQTPHSHYECYTLRYGSGVDRLGWPDGKHSDCFGCVSNFAVRACLLLDEERGLGVGDALKAHVGRVTAVSGLHGAEEHRCSLELRL